MISISIGSKTGASERQLLEHVIKQNGWISSPPYNLQWNCKNSQTADITNRIPGINHICRKTTITLCLRAFQAFCPGEFDFYPKTFIVPHELNKFNSNGRWIAKPSNGTQGRGIFLVKDKNELIQRLMHTDSDMVVQEYIEPLLLEGKKFDLRVYVLISSLDPLVCYINKEGLVRLCSETYNDKSVFGQITNYSLNHGHHKFINPIDIQDENGNKRSFSILKKQLLQHGIDSNPIFNQIEKIAALTIKSIYPFLTQKSNTKDSFAILGLDILIDKQLKPWLLEINALPSFSIHTGKEISELDLHIKSIIVQDAIKIMYQLPQESYINISEAYQLQANVITDLLRAYQFCNNNQLLNCSQFCKLCLFPGMRTNKITKAEYEIAFIRSLREKEQRLMDFFEFLEAIQLMARVFGLSLLDYTIMICINF